MKYFLHDTSSFDDEKITELYINFGYEGLGLFYTILEKLAKQEKPVKTSVLKSQLGVGKRLEKCWSFMEQIGIISSNNGETFNKQLLNFSEKYQIKKQKNNDRISEWREKQKDTENVTRYERVSNTPKVKLSKVKESKVNIYTPGLDEFLEFAKEKTGSDFEALKKPLTNKYDAWVLNGWRTGGDKPRKIVNWKTTLLNTIQYLKPNGQQGKSFDDRIRAI